MGSRKFSVLLLEVLAVLLLSISSTGYAHNGADHQSGEQGANLNSALHWLEVSQLPNGDVTNTSDISTSLQSTAEALTVFQLLESSSADKQAALEFLRGNLLNLNSEQLSRLLLGLAEAGQPHHEEKAELLSRQGTDGGFGHFEGYDSTALDTSYALLALQAAGSDALIAGEVLQFFSSVQQADGSFPLYEDQASVMVTALATKALRPYLYTHDISDVLREAVNYLYSAQNADGHWGTAWESALALQALIPVTTDVGKYSKAVDFLKTSQSPEGDWGQQVYSTSLSVAALNMLASIDVPVDPEKAVVAGRLVAASSGVNIPNATIDVLGASDEDVAINSDGSFVISNLGADSHVVAYSAPGYLGASQSITLRKGQFANVGTIRLVVAPTTVLISGVIRESASGSPVPGVTIISVVGGSTNSAVSGINGEYQLLSEPGAATLSVQSSDYYPVSATADLQAGTQISFSPSLQALTDEQPDSSSISGTVVDNNEQPIEGASISILDGNAVFTTDETGSFELSDLNGGDISVAVSKSGFESVNFGLLVPDRTNVDIGYISLKEEEVLPSTSIRGQVVDMVTGLGVPGASVSVGGSKTTSDVNGFYQISDIPVLEFTVSTNASGYLFSNKDVSLAEHADLNLDINIRKADLGGVNIVQATTDKSVYGAYEPVLITADVENDTALNQGARFYVRVLNSEGIEVESFSGANLPPIDPQSDPEELAHYQEHLEAAIQDFAPGEQRSIKLEQWWNTLVAKPGVYTITVQALDGTTSNLVSESSTTVTVEPTSVLASLDPKASPGYVLLNNQADIELYAEIYNRSNIPVNLEFDYSLTHPDGRVITQGHSQLELAPENTNARQVLSVLPYDFDASGEYRLVVENVSGATVSSQSTGIVFVPPSIRLKATQSLSPGEVVPLEGVSVESKIQVEGVDGE
ncbi:carboxypeptidase regulatory-like domain-containing protein [Marinobacter algicola]|uniref:Putative lipoprotein n=1 Tax=Marinobacter algicola DG893 TaxID=443152 RepID=A6F563_9GAMM|nr:carboxypeptidase regulatory-like domain-containing protein [Marinobacter algicola]EDM46100.1 putative lipoprotein [Marinobacter algicola DG893]